LLQLAPALFDFRAFAIDQKIVGVAAAIVKADADIAGAVGVDRGLELIEKGWPLPSILLLTRT